MSYSTSSQVLQQEGSQLLSLFKNAVSYTLAITALTELSKSTPDYLFLILGTLACTVLLLFIQTEVNLILKSTKFTTAIGSLYEFVLGPLKCLSFLLSIIVNILTQFLSTLIAKYVLTFTPNLANFEEIVYILLVILSLFWCVIYAVGVDWHQL